MKPFAWFKALSITKKLAAGLGGLFIVGAIGAAANPSAPVAPASVPSVTQLQQSQQTTETKLVTETQQIPFSTETVNDGAFPRGQTLIRQAGIDGAKTITYEVTYKNGIEISRVQKSEEVTTQPVAQIVANGTHIATSGLSNNNTYTNVDGNTVHSPAYSTNGSVPTGATALCRDGTYSFSQHRSGTCSYHGGVAQWL